MKILRLFAILTLFTLLSTSLVAQKKPNLPPNYPKGTIIVPKFSAKLLDFQKISLWSGRVSYSTTLTFDDDYTIGFVTDWKDRGWPLMQEFAIEKIGKENKRFLLECRTTTANLKIFLDPSISDMGEAFDRIFYKGSVYDFKKSDYYAQNVVDNFLPKIFSGKLASFPKEMQIRMIEGANYNSDAIKGEDFKGNFYLSLDLGNDSVYYNTIQVNQAERTARTVERIIGAGLKQASDLDRFPEIEGLKITISVGYSDFLREGQYPAHSDQIEAYFLLETIRDYQNADITNQQLIDKSIVLVNGNRVQVSLTQFN